MTIVNINIDVVDQHQITSIYSALHAKNNIYVCFEDDEKGHLKRSNQLEVGRINAISK